MKFNLVVLFSVMAASVNAGGAGWLGLAKVFQGVGKAVTPSANAT